MSDRSAIDALATRLRPHYSRFLSAAGDDVLLTAHSHQAWPDVSRDAQIRAWDDAAKMADEKWSSVFSTLIPKVRSQIASRIGTARADHIALAQNTGELCFRLGSCFPESSTVVTTDSEFHSLRRQLDRSEEDGAKIVRVPTGGADFSARFCRALDDERPAWAALSYVLFGTSRLVSEIDTILEAAAKLGIYVLVDAYHAFNTVPLDVDRWPGKVFVVGGGYKYAQVGEGACFMLLPKEVDQLRPRFTGWFADFAHLDGPSSGVRYAAGGDRFFGSTFDPTPLYRASAVFDFMDQLALTPQVLRAQSLRQTDLIIGRKDQLASLGADLKTPTAPECRGAFVAFRHPRAKELCAELKAHQVRTDSRGELLRFGPGPYTTSAEIDRALDAFERVLRS